MKQIKFGKWTYTPKGYWKSYVEGGRTGDWWDHYCVIHRRVQVNLRTLKCNYCKAEVPDNLKLIIKLHRFAR